MASSLDQRCAKIVRDMEERLERYQSFYDRYLKTLRRNQLMNGKYRKHKASNLSSKRIDHIYLEIKELVYDIYHTKRCHAAYDEAYRNACSDPTGQDLDSFHYSE